MNKLLTLEGKNEEAKEKACAARTRAFDGIANLLQMKNTFPYRGFVEVSVGDAQSFLMFCNNDDPVALHYFWYGADAWEKFSVLTWIRILSIQRGAILDVGAFSGLYSLISASTGHEEIFAIEASRMPLGRLLDNINCNGFGRKINVIPKAMSDYQGRGEFSLRREIGTLSTGGSLLKLGGGTEPVDVNTLDCEFAGRTTPIGAIKVDVEGAELQVLKGGANLISTDRPAILIEIKATELTSIVSFFQDLDYRGATLCESAEQLTEINLTANITQNYLFYPVDFPISAITSL